MVSNSVKFSKILSDTFKIGLFFFENVIGSVDLEELIYAFKDLGVDIDKAEASKLLARLVDCNKINSFHRIASKPKRSILYNL